MNRTLPLAVAAVATLAACQMPPQTDTASQEQKIVTNVHPYTPGNGVVQSVFPAPSTTAGAGGTGEPMQRLEIRMDNGTLQYVDTPSRDFQKGQRITLTEDKIIRPLGG